MTLPIVSLVISLLNEKVFEGVTESLTSEVTCALGWEDTGELGLGCLSYHDTPLQWLDADKYCQNRDSHLVEVNNLEQMEYLAVEMAIRGSVTGYW